MRWERKIPLWPKLAALGALFVLALGAPRNWQSTSPQSTPSPAWPQSELPAVANPQVQAEQFPEQFLEQLPAKISESLPLRREFNLETLVTIRDLLLNGFEPLPTPEPTRLPAISIPQVRVSSENDRIASLPRRVRDNTRPTRPVFPSNTTEYEVASFAAILLEAARRPKPVEFKPLTGLRLAMRPTTPVPNEPVMPAEPQAERISNPEPEQLELPIIEPAALRHRPLALVKQLESFDPGSPGAVWSQQVLAQLAQLTEERSSNSPAVAKTLEQLEQLFVEGIEQSEDPAHLNYHNQWQQSAQSLGRRLVLWRFLLDPEQPRVIDGSSATTNLLPVLNEVAELLAEAENGDEWREYLLLEKIAAALSEGMSSPTLARAKLAQDVLSRMADPQLTEAQRAFLTTEPFLHLHQELRPWAAGKVNLETLTAIVERYESGRESRYAEVIEQLRQRLKWSENPQLQVLAAHLDEHYRSANMRLALSDELLNRMLPKQKPIVTPVRERIAGAKVRGRARTTTQLRLRLLPDSDAWHFALDAFGKVYSDTKSDTWPARIRNAAKMHYQARKEISIDEQGLHITPAQATAKGRNELIGVDSQLDPIPLLGFLLRDMAAKKHKKSRPAALTQAKAKVVRSAKQRMDATLNEKLEVFEQKFRDKVLTRIEQLALLAEPLDMYTTQQRAVMQLRLANSGQLAAHTLRPLAPSDSVLSLQMHETALNNAMMGLGLDGRRMTMQELFDFLTQRFGQPGATPPEDMPRRAIIHFAKRDAARVQCEGDQLELVLSVAELAHRRDKIKNFQIHVHFRPLLSGLSVKLVRDGTLQFSGRRLKTGPRVVLHSVIGKLLEQDHEITLLNAKVQEDPRLAGLMITQLVIEDGWIGLALGPAHPSRTAWRADTPEVLSTPFVR